MTTRLFNRWTNWIVDRPLITMLVLVVITAGAIAGHIAPERVLAILYPQPEAADESQPRTQSDDYDEEVPDVNPFSVAEADAIIVVESDALFSPDGARTLRHVVKRLKAADYVLRHARTFSRLGIGLTVLLAVISLGLRPDERNTEGLPSSAEPVVALKKMDKALGGLEFADVRVKWDSSVASDAPEVLAVITKVDELLRSEPLVGHPISIRSLIDSLPGDPQAANRMPMLELLPPELKRAFYTPERRRGDVTFRVQDIGIAKYGPVFERIDAGLAAIRVEHPAFDLDLRGSAVWRWENLYQILIDMLKSLTSASLIIFAVLALVYRSIRIGLISVIPNLFPLVLSAACLVVAGQYLEFVSVCAFTICLGIAVDDTIHFLTRYTEELQKTDDERAAIRAAFTGVGTALIMTTLVLLAGFVTVAFGDSREVRIFASMGGITIGSALLGDLLFLPALLARYTRQPDRDADQTDKTIAHNADNERQSQGSGSTR